jgi:hypothetical protein
MKPVFKGQMLITFIPSIFILVAMVMVSVLFQVSISHMTMDVTAITDINPLSGILSSFGVLLWCAAASICFFTAMILRNVKSRDTFWFLLYSSLLSTYLLFDDLFLFHEQLSPQYLGLKEKVVLIALVISVSVFLIKFRQVILRTNFGMLLLALGFFATSLVIDVMLEPWLRQLGHWVYLFEEGAKWLGIASWCSYFVHTSHQLLVSNFGLHNNVIPSNAHILHR